MSNDIANKESHAPQASDASAIISVIERAATNPDVDVDKMERLLDMQERILNRNAQMAFNAAMTAAQSEMRRVSTDATNPQTRSQYATYPALDKALRQVYTKHGFSLSFDTGENPPAGYVRVVCHVSHSEGFSRAYHADMPADGLGAKGNAVMTKTHATGSAMSYGMRYLLKMIFNVAIGEDDDDGNTAAAPRVSDDQAANINALIEEVGADKAAFLKYMQAESVDRIRADEYSRAIAALEKKRRAQ